MKNIEQPVRLPSTSCLPDRPKPKPGRLKIIATFAEANVIRPHSGTSRLKVISQGGNSVALERDSEEDVYYRNDSVGERSATWRKKERRW